MIKPFFNAVPVKGRQCGDCHVCCERLSIDCEELKKPLNVLCEHVCEKGCGIYDQRPKPCRNFICGWLNGIVGGESHRPDKLGIMVTSYLHNGEYVLHVHESWENAFKEEKVQRILGELGSRSPIVVVFFGGKLGLIGTKKQNEEFVKRHINNYDFNTGEKL